MSMTPQQQADEMARKCAAMLEELNQERGGFDAIDEVEKIIKDFMHPVELLECVEAARELHCTPARSSFVKDAISHQFLDAKAKLELALTNLDRAMKGEKV